MPPAGKRSDSWFRPATRSSWQRRRRPRGCTDSPPGPAPGVYLRQHRTATASDLRQLLGTPPPGSRSPSWNVSTATESPGGKATCGDWPERPIRVQEPATARPSVRRQPPERQDRNQPHRKKESPGSSGRTFPSPPARVLTERRRWGSPGPRSRPRSRPPPPASPSRAAPWPTVPGTRASHSHRA